MPRRSEPKAATYEIAVAEITATFDLLPVNPRPASTRDWVMESSAAQILGLTKKALERRRARGTAPTHQKLAGYVVYCLEDLDAWVAIKPKGYRPAPDT